MPWRRCGCRAPRRAFGHHWGTFRLTNEAVEQPAQDLAAALAARDIPADRFPALRPGEVQVVELALGLGSGRRLSATAARRTCLR